MKRLSFETIELATLEKVTGGCDNCKGSVTFRSTPQELQSYGECEQRAMRQPTRGAQQKAMNSCYVDLIVSGARRAISDPGGRR